MSENCKRTEEARIAYSAAIRALLPPRAADGNKGSFGRVRIIAGSATYTGAALLAAEGALRLGAGYVSLFAPPAVTAPARIRLPELLCREMPPVLDAPEAYLPLFELPADRGAILLGPGLGTVAKNGSPADAPLFASVVARALGEAGAPVILDADALNLIARAEEAPAAYLARAARPLVITPHPLELSRLTGWTPAEIASDRIRAAQDFATRSGAVVLLKGKGTVIASPTGAYAVNPTGSTALAKAGSGDVLSGMIAALIAGGASLYDAVRIAAYLHGSAGDAAAQRLTERGVLPSELPREAALALARLLAESGE